MFIVPGSAPLGAGRLAGRWQSDLCDMAGAPGGTDRCLYVHLCWPLAAGEVAQRTGGNYFLDCCIGGTLGFAYAFSCFIWAPSRARLRTLHGIPGSLLEDVAVTALLPCCYLAQALNHLDIVDARAHATTATTASPPTPFAGAPK